MDSIKCINHNDRFDSLKCTSVTVAGCAAATDSHSHYHLQKSSPSTVKKQNDSVRKCPYCINTIRSQSEHSEQRRLYRTYSSFGLKNLNKNCSSSHWSLNESTSKSWSDERYNKKITCEAKCKLIDFHRCMKLLGVDTNSQEDIRESLQHRKVLNTKKVRPKISTRIMSKTISLEDVQHALTNDLERTNLFDQGNRSFLAQAVYERWYFNKMQEYKKQRKEAELKNEQMRMEIEQMRCEQKLKAEISYQEWMKKKKRKNLLTKSDTADRSNKSSEKRFMAKNSTDGYIKWKTAKNDELKKKRHQWKEQKEREKEETQRKKIEAEKAYQSWKNRVNEELKKEVDSQRKREIENKEQANRDKMEKQKEARTSFNAWKQNKLQQIKKNRNEQKFESKVKMNARTQRIAERLYEAEQAFYQWLESVDERITSAK